MLFEVPFKKIIGYMANNSFSISDSIVLVTI